MKAPKLAQRLRRKARVRASLCAQSTRPRLSIFRSNLSMYAQIIDDAKGVTLVSASDKADKKITGTKTERARKVGELIGKLAQEKGISQVAFDRNGFLYHGRVKALADGARSAGLDF